MSPSSGFSFRGSPPLLPALSAAFVFCVVASLFVIPRSQFEYFLQSSVRISTPLILAALGELVAEKAGLINIGVEGMVLVGAFASFAVVSSTGALPLGVVAAILSGMLLGSLFGILCISRRHDQIVVGAALNFLALGTTGLLYRSLYGATGSTKTIEPFAEWNILGLDGIPCIGPAVFSQTTLTYAAILLAVSISFVFRKTRIGFNLEAVGEHPRAADAAGLSVNGIRWTAILFEGALGGLAGSALALSLSNTFNEGMSNGRGFIAIAVVIFGRWKPLGVLAAALFFGSAESLQLQLQATELSWLRNNYPYLQMLPYLVTLVVLVAAVGRVRAPSALGRHYHRE